MSSVVIKPPSMEKLLNEQRVINSSLSMPPEHRTVYMTSPPAALTSVYHSRGCVSLLELENDSNAKPHACEAAAEEAPLLGALMNAPPRLNLELEKTLALTCRVLNRACSQSSELSVQAREHLSRLVDMGAQFAAPMTPPE